MNNNIQELYEKYYSSVYKFFCKKIGENDAEDLTQQTFIKLITWISCIDKMRSPKSLVFTVAKSVLCDYFRTKKLLELSVSFDELYDHADNYDFTNEVESSDFLNKLTKRERQIVELKVQGYNSLEIGKKLGLSGSTVRTYLEKVRKKIR
ncbi:MAG: sigma-70 family RNA polymerase sigma factor [Candidatus Gastranaerophilales bacterium]|nr:sigma-70 family RNA polymerase sigma factor [Candidatus Gastranaerophilales bacterium]